MCFFRPIAEIFFFFLNEQMLRTEDKQLDMSEFNNMN